MKIIIFLLLFLLSACTVSVKKASLWEAQSQKFSLNVATVEVVSMMQNSDTANHVEQKMPISPETAVNDWVKNHLKTTKGSFEKMVLLIHQAEVLKEEKKNASYFKFDEEEYTLNYSFEIQIYKGERILKRIPLSGKGFVSMAKKASLASKEEKLSWMIKKMLTHLENKIKSDLKYDEFS